MSRMLTASSRAMRPVAGGAVALSRRAGAFAMGQRRAYQGNLQDKDRIFTNLCAPPTNRAGRLLASSPHRLRARFHRYNDTDWGIQGAMKRGDWCPLPLTPPTPHQTTPANRRHCFAYPLVYHVAPALRPRRYKTKEIVLLGPEQASAALGPASLGPCRGGGGDSMLRREGRR